MGKRRGGSRSHSRSHRSHGHSHRGIGHRHRGVKHHSHRHHHSTYRGPRVVHTNPYVNSPNTITLTWDRTIHGYNENDPNLDKMAAEGYDPSPVRKIVAELNALSKSMNFDDEVPEANPIIAIILFILGIFPGFFYLMWIDCKVQSYLANETKLRAASQPILAKYNQTTLRELRYYTDAGGYYPYVLAIHLVRENQANGDPNDHQARLNILVNQMRANPDLPFPNMDLFYELPIQDVALQMQPQDGISNQMAINQVQTHPQAFYA